MAVYDWPYGGKAFWPRAARWRTLINERATVSALSGYTQTGSTPGARWGVALDIDRQSYAERLALKGFIDRLQGNKHRVGMFDPAHPVPAGTVALSGVALSASAAQFATSLQLSGCRHARNALLGGSFEIDSNADGLADGWSRLSAGSVSGLSHFLSGTYWLGSYSQRLSVTTLGSTTSDQQGIWRSGVAVSWLAGAPATASCGVLGDSGTSVTLLVKWINASAAVIGSMQATVALTGAVQTVVATGTVPAAAVTAEVYVYQHSSSVSAPGFYVDCLQIEPGAAFTAHLAPATLLAGDWVGAASGQLLSVVTDVTADDLGRVTVEVVQPLRTALASASAITLDKPRTPMVLQLSNGATPEIPFDGNGLAPPFTLELVEGWTA